MRVLISGASGLIGSHLATRLVAEGHQVWGLSRRERPASQSVARWFAWDSLSGPPPAASLEGVEAVVHLAGEPVLDAPWTPERKQQLLESRRAGTRHLVQALAGASARPRVLISASAVGYYGDRGQERLTEEAAPGRGLLSEICLAWEQEAMRASALGVRVVCPRIGVALSPEGGALAKMVLPLRLAVGGKVGSGTQVVPWIHLQDLLGVLCFALFHQEVQGPLNAVAPGAVTNRELAQTLGRVLRRPVIGVPAAVLRLAMGERAQALIEGQRPVPDKLLELGFAFRFPELEPALRDLLR